MEFTEKKEVLKQEIKEHVTIIDLSKLTFTSLLEYRSYAQGNDWTAAIQQAINEKKCVYIPDMQHEILLSRPIVLSSDCHLKVSPQQVIRLLPHRNTCLVRNKNIAAGTHQYTEQINPDERISVSGGIWTAPDNGAGAIDLVASLRGGFGLFEFSNVNQINVTDCTFRNSGSYAVHIGNCHDFYVNHIQFYEYHKDGIHINGPTKYGYIGNLSGKDLGDDLVALNAWDWFNAAITFGDIEHVLVENVQSDNNEIRLLTGRKLYGNDTAADCAIRNCVFENITGVYTFKLYYQPNCANAVVGFDMDASDSVGEMSNLYFSDISFPIIRQTGFNQIPIQGLFDILSNGTNLHFEQIKVQQSAEDLRKMGISLISAGPISATYQVSEDPASWGDFFQPNAVCHVDGITCKDITFAGKQEIDPALIAKEVHQTVNTDYPHSLPQGGTGYGTIKNIEVRI